MRCEFGKHLPAIDLVQRMKVNSVSIPYDLFKRYPDSHASPPSFDATISWHRSLNGLACQ
jgi:hypothetical protein